MAFITLVIPTFNETTLTHSILKLIGFLKTIPDHQFELVLVDDSHDGTYEQLQEFLPRLEIQTQLLRGLGKGKGCAIQQGAKEARGEITFYMDADFTIPLGNIPRFIQKIVREDFDVVIGERYQPRTLKRFLENPFRFLLSIGLLFAQRYFIFQSHYFYDTQCGFKAFKTHVLQSMAHRQRIMGGMFDIEYLYLAKKNHFRISKHNVFPLPEVRASTIRVFRCLWNDPIDLFRIKLHGLKGHYSFNPLQDSLKIPSDRAKTAMQSTPAS